MIPPFSVSGVLPPFVGEEPAIPSAQAPYRITMLELVQRFAISLERIAILEGLFEYRSKMRSLNVMGYQWLDGSFVEDCERTRGRAPADIDLITFAYRPRDEEGQFIDAGAFVELMDLHPDLFESETAKQVYMCDAYYVDFNQAPHTLAAAVTYWCNLFSHSRMQNLWKGILQVDLNVDDSEAIAILGNIKSELLAAQGGRE
ncbi:hypothetical protein EDC53_102368 [Phytobacter diazotrophicus]|nr:hypothetical protein EDC53_102368 [Phytobacter diazotrophicus]